jgi:N-acyl amino acid synthase of PEP-CTERM/exosortase system
MEKLEILGLYKKYFKFLYADNDDLRELVYNIRYQVFCREFGFEREEDYPDGKEWDEFDERSLHCILIHKPSDTAVGCVRLIMPLDSSTSLLPLEMCCGEAVDKNKFDLSSNGKRNFGEISRLAVLSNFRRRSSDIQGPVSIPDQNKVIKSGRDTFPLISVSLSLGILSMLLNSGLEHGLAMMEPRLTRLLRRYGIVFKQIGDIVDYHGRRGPFLITREDILPSLSPKVLPLMKVIDTELKIVTEIKR